MMTGTKLALAMLLLGVCGVFSTAGPELIAQTDGVPGVTSSDGIESIGERLLTKAITALGPLAILGWFLWHASTKMLPAKDAQLVAEREGYAAEMQRERIAHKAEIDSILAELHKEREATLTVIRACEARRAGT